MTIATTSLSPATPGIIYQGTLSMSGGTAPFSWSVQSGTLPAGLALDPITGIISGIPTTAGTNNFSIQVTDATSSTKIQALSIAVSAQIAISSIATLPTAPLNADYSQTLSATGGRIPYTWSITSGSLPTGLTIAPATGIVSGKVTAPGTYNFVVQVTDADGRTATQTASASTTSTTSPPAILAITSGTLPAGQVNAAYSSTTLAATGGTVPRSWSVINGTLPPGMDLDSATGIISGTPTKGGNYDIIFQVVDSDMKSATQTISISVADPTITAGTVQFLNGAVQTSSLLFGNIYKSDSNKKTVSISNTTSTAVSITNITSDSSAFTVSGAPFTIPASSTVPFDISFTPSLAQAYTGTITLTDSNGSKYQLVVSGTGIGVNVALKSGATGTVSYFNERSVSSLSTINKPTTFNALSAADFQISGVPSGSTATVDVSFSAMPTTPVFYKLDASNAWVALAGVTVVGNVVSIDIADNSSLDSNNTAGIISGDTIVVGTTGTSTTPTTTGGGTLTAGNSGGSSGCFIATAAFGSYLDPHVMVLRHFRDDVLLQSKLGTAFVSFYYKHSPPIADFIAQHDTLRMIIRFALTPLIFAVKYPIVVTLLFAMAGVWFFRRRFALKQQQEMAHNVG
jgi:hypothetical protein